jgi:hypothetical protein
MENYLADLPGLWASNKVTFTSQNTHKEMFILFAEREQTKQTNSLALVRERTIPTETPRFVSEVK